MAQHAATPSQATSQPTSQPTTRPHPGDRSTQDMARRLREIARSVPAETSYNTGGELRLRSRQAALEAATDERQRIEARARLGYELLRSGKNREALAEFEKIRDRLLKPDAGVSTESLQQIEGLIATAHLRVAETDNCLSLHTAESCLFPIRGKGVHTERTGSEGAIATLVPMLERRPDDLASRWLLNLAHMTLGSYPEGVPSAYRIDPSRFASKASAPRFENIAVRAKVDRHGLAGGSVLEDFNGDGYLDLITSDWDFTAPLRVQFGQASGGFRDVTATSGVADLVGGLNINQADYNNDGHLDIFITRGAWFRESGRFPNSLLRNNGDGTFTDVTEEAGLLSFNPTQAAAWADFDGDGWIDLFIGNESSTGAVHPCELYRNNGDGTFDEVAEALGVNYTGFVKAVAWGDADNDGSPDLYLSVIGAGNVLYRNLGYTFVDVTPRAGVAEPSLSFPTWFFDYDNDGWLDILVLPFPGFSEDTLGQVAAGYLGESNTLERPRLYRNNKRGRFTEVSNRVGLTDGMLAMGANFGDIDNDGYLDIYVGTGEPTLHTIIPNRLYRNMAGKSFENVTTAAGVGHLQKGHAISFGDIDNDGDQDIYAVMGGAFESDTAYNALFLNPGNENRSITLKLEGVKCNRAAIGARISVGVWDPSGRERFVHRVIGSGGSFGASPLRAEIGLGDATEIRRIMISWPGGRKQRIMTSKEIPIELDRAYRIREGERPVEIELPQAKY